MAAADAAATATVDTILVVYISNADDVFCNIICEILQS